jgi:hypothetical protein
MADCPGTVNPGASCSAAERSCSSDAKTCVCTSGVWDCGYVPRIDMSVPDLSLHDLATGGTQD